MTVLKLIKCKILTVISICAVLLSGCSSLAPSNGLSLSDDVEEYQSFNTSPETEARFLFVKGEMALKRDDYKEALELFEKSKQKSHELSPTLLKRLAQIYIREGQLEQALKASEEMEQAGGDLDDCYKLRAGILNALGRTEESIKVYQQIVSRAKPGDEEPYLLLSGAYIQNSKFNDAVLVLENLCKNNPESFIGSYYLAKLYASLKDYEKSLSYYRRALKLNSTSDQVKLEYIKVLVLSQHFPEAVKECQKLVNENPDNEKARELLNELLLGEKKIESAINDFEEAKKSGKNSIDMQFKIALIKLQQRDFKGAESELSLILSQRPDHDEARYYLATSFASQDKIPAAVQELRKISPKNDLYKKARGFAGFLLRQDKKFAEALDLIAEALKQFPNDVELLGYKTSIERESGDVKGAIETLRQISNLEPENEQHLFNLGVALDEANNKSEALKVIEEVLVKNPQHANALNYVGYSLAEEGKDLARAEELITKALEIEKENGFFLDSLGWVYFQMGKSDKALPVLERANELTNGDAVILEHLGQVYMKLGMQDKAKQVFNIALERLAKSNLENDLKLKAKINETLKTIP